MVHPTENPSAAEATKPVEQEEFTGAFGFFRKYQKPILYTAGMFALVTFSVTGAMMSSFDRMFRGDVPRASIVVNNTRVKLEDEDFYYGIQLAQGRYAPTVVLPVLGDAGGADSELQDTYAILRRAALTEGLDVSDKEVDDAIKFARESVKAATDQELAARVGSSSLAAYRSVVREAMRIGNYVRLQALAADGSDAALIRELLDGLEKVELRVATLDGKALEEGLKAGTKPTDDELRAWLDAKDENWKNLNQVFDTNKVALEVGAVEMEQLDPAEWTAELEGLDLGEAVTSRIYEEEKGRLFKVNPDTWRAEGGQDPVPEFYPQESDKVKTAVQRIARSEEVMNKLLAKVRERREAGLSTATNAVNAATDARNTAQAAHKDAVMKAEAPGADEAAKKLAADRQAELTARQAELDAATKALEEARGAFDFRTAFNELTSGKKGFKLVVVPEPLNAEGLKTLPELGEWPNPFLATALAQKGELGSMVARTPTAAFLFRVTDVVQRPLKAWDSLRPILETQWFVEKAKEQAEAKKKQFEDALLRLAKDRIPDEVKAIEAKRQERIDTSFAAWQKQAQERLAAAEARLKEVRAGSAAATSWQAERDSAAAALASAEEKKKNIEADTTKAIETEVAAAAKKHHAAVLDAAAAEAGFTVRKVGPYRRDLASMPRVDKRFDETVVFVMRSEASKLKAGESTAVLEDMTARRWHVASCDLVMPCTAEDLTRREFFMRKEGFGATFRDDQAMTALQQSYTIDALKQRYAFELPRELPVIEPPAK
ncbi:MAG: hypothetical protein RL148_209 [Planctomycetota bacterium]|jgi:hypothetical protein